MSAARSLSPVDELEAAFTEGSIRALRRRAEVIRKRASVNVNVLDRSPPIIIVASDSAHAFKIARDWDRVAAALEAEGS
jgi:hypothetical protein